MRSKGASVANEQSDLKKEKMDFLGRLRLAVELVGGVNAAVKITGKNANQLYRYMNGQNEPGLGPMTQLANQAGLSLNWIVSGEGPQRFGDLKSGDSELILMTAEKGYELAFGSKLAGELRLDQKHTELIVSESDNMAPTIGMGDMVVVDKSATSFSTGLFQVDINGSVTLARVLVTPNKIHFSFDNPAYKGFEVDRSDFSEVNCLAAVIWVGKRI